MNSNVAIAISGFPYLALSNSLDRERFKINHYNTEGWSNTKEALVTAIGALKTVPGVLHVMLAPCVTPPPSNTGNTVIESGAGSLVRGQHIAFVKDVWKFILTGKYDMHPTTWGMMIRSDSNTLTEKPDIGWLQDNVPDKRLRDYRNIGYVINKWLSHKHGVEHLLNTVQLLTSDMVCTDA